MLEQNAPSLYKSRVQGPCSFDMLHHLARCLFSGLNGQINHVTDCGQEMNGCSIIRLRPNLCAIGQQKPGAPQMPRRLFKLFASMSACLLQQTLHFVRLGECYFVMMASTFLFLDNLGCTCGRSSLFIRINRGLCVNLFTPSFSKYYKVLLLFVKYSLVQSRFCSDFNGLSLQEKKMVWR